MKIKSRYYVGYVKGDFSFKTFTATETPTAESHGKLYAAVIGPFRTKKGAQFMQQYGRNNPHCRTVADAERLAKKYA